MLDCGELSSQPESLLQAISLLTNIRHRLAASEWVNVCVIVGGVGLPISNASGLLSLFPARRAFDDCCHDALR
jgi:hypothetical protein